MNLGDKVKHKNVFIQGEVVEVDAEQVVHVQCNGGTYYDAEDNWEPIESATTQTEQVDDVVQTEQVKPPDSEK